MSIEMSAENPILGTVHNDTSEENRRKLAENCQPRPNFRYTTILLKKMKENDRNMSTKNPILGTQRCF